MYKPILGLEVHIELNTRSKMFCSCRNDPDEEGPNINVCPICMGHPGTLPVINKEAVKKVIKTALALNCQIEETNFFERKNYFYPDLPKGYQISQYTAPMSRNGYLELSCGKRIGITRIHLEEDTGKLLHPEGKDYSLVDFNRAGVPLMELVTEPDINSGEEAKEFIKELQVILRYLDVSEANMEKGEMRCEVNISLAESTAEKLGRKVEIKNLNSVRVVGKAIDYEAERQTKILEKKKKVVQETRGWHDKKEITFSQREKEEAHDYRYFPEPDLPPLKLENNFLTEIKAEIPELPSQRRKRIGEEYGISTLSPKVIELFVSQKDLGEYFEKVISELKTWVKTKKPEMDLEGEEFKKLIKLASNYLTTDLLGLLERAEFREEAVSITPENFAEFVSMIATGEISSKIAKVVLKEMFETGGDPSQIIKDKGLEQITDSGEIEEAVREIIKANPKPVADYKEGKERVFQFLIGQVMAKTKGKANPQAVSEILRKLLCAD